MTKLKGRLQFTKYYNEIKFYFLSFYHLFDEVKNLN